MFLICGADGHTGRAASVYVPQTIAGTSCSAEPAGRAVGLVAVRTQRASAAAAQIAPRSPRPNPHFTGP
jgi:hypothetical protein